LLVTIASALIVARALRPQKSLVLAPDMVVTPNDGVQIRFMVVRGGGGTRWKGCFMRWK
jgi:hypothetical protein